jgi:hypothetical protein
MTVFDDGLMAVSEDPRYSKNWSFPACTGIVVPGVNI